MVPAHGGDRSTFSGDYAPVVDEDGFPTDPTGQCSSPVPLPDSFEPACGTHDLGYDLLRVADSKGEEIPTDLRPSMDRQLVTRIGGTCPSAVLPKVGCRLTVTAVDAVLSVNTWRQGSGAPVSEVLPWPTPG